MNPHKKVGDDKYFLESHIIKEDHKPEHSS